MIKGDQQTKMAIVPILCTQCMASVDIDDKKGKGRCEFCGTMVMLKEKAEKKEQPKPNSNNVSQNSGTADAFGSIFSNIDKTVDQVSRTTSKIIWISSVIIGVIIAFAVLVPTIRAVSNISNITIPDITIPGGGGGTPSGAVVGAGEWRVGEGAAFDIQPGRYLVIQSSTSTSGSVRLATAPGVTSSSQQGHIFLVTFSNRQYIDLEAGQFVTISRAALWNLADTPAIDQTAAYFPEGQYLVGRDIPAGNYRAEQVSGSGGSFRITTNPNATSSSHPGHIRLTTFSGQAFVPTLVDGQFITISRGRLVFLD